MKQKTTLLKALALSTSAYCVMTGAAQADQVFLDDVIVDGSLCVGMDCVNGESFGFDTLRLKENNLRIHFDDTSASASFPSNDWRLIANSSANGGDSFFKIEDSTAGRVVFQVDAGARNNALYVDSQGDIGIGTGAPATDIDIKTGDTPTVRLQQDGTSGFTPQTWDMAGNETNFFIRDATNGSTLPFRIRPGAPTDSLAIEATGDVGIGTSNPTDAKLHIKDTDSAFAVNLLLEKNGTPRMRFDNSATASAGVWDIGLTSADEFLIRDITGASNVFKIDGTGTLTLTGGLISTSGGGACTLADPCDRVFDKTAYDVPTIEDHAAQMWENQYLPAVGPTTPEAPVNVTKKMLRMLNELEKAHIYIEQLNGRIVTLEASLSDELTVTE